MAGGGGNSRLEDENCHRGCQGVIDTRGEGTRELNLRLAAPGK